MNVLYPARITEEEDGLFFVEFLDLQEAITEGETLEEAQFNAQETLTLTIEGRIEEKMDIPEASQAEGEDIYMIAPSASAQAALLVHRSLTSGGVTMATLARSLGTSWPSAARLIKPRHSPNLRTLEKAAAAMGKKLLISFE